MKSLFARRPTPAPLAHRLAWCERVTATPTSPDHLRIVLAGDDLVLGGGLTATPLCGTDLRRGWDLRLLTDLEELRTRLSNEHPTSRVCAACAERALTQVGAAPVVAVLSDSPHDHGAGTPVVLHTSEQVNLALSSGQQVVAGPSEDGPWTPYIPRDTVRPTAR